ncbi:DUF6701 domain-containing protein, partial [Propionivibrio sp.]|uniref:DUF6701 domain-containing protein n=1 Tax=Propionivibrio sp. TaxID=2212460 RepID=UPI003BF207E0
RPTSFSVISPNATNTATGGTPFFKAGTTPFGLDAASKTNTTPLTNYTGTAKINSGRIAAHPGAVQAGSVDGVFSPATSASGISKGMAFTYSEVGNFQFLPWGVYDDGSFADVDRGKATPECFIDGKLGSAIVPADPNVKDGNGKYGCYFGGTKPPTSSNTSGGATASSLFFGRFIPDHFLVTAGTTKPACAPPGATNPFTYFGQDFTTEFTLTAQNASGNTTQNYDGNIGYAKLPLTAWGAAPAPGFGFAVGTWSPAQPAGTPAAVLANSATADTAPTPTATNSNTWSAGTTTVTARHMIVRPTSAPAVPTTITVTALPVDSDGVTTLPVTPSTTPSPTLISSTLLLQRFGRLRLIPGQGSNLAPFKMQTEVQYWDGTYWRTNVADSCTTLASGNFAVSGTTGTTASTAAGISQGYGSILLTRPTSVGTATICMDMATTANDCTVTTPPNLGYLLGGPAYNTDPSATVFFGGASSNSRGNWGYLYRRENF